MSRQKRPFKPVREGQVRLYVCGMTVYDFCHLGHARMLVSFDVIQRWLRTSGYDVQYVRNITDIDDKIIRRAVQTGQRLSEVTAFFIDAMHADERVLNVQSPDDQPRATAFVPQMLDIIEQLQTRGLAYQADDGDVNFSVRSFPSYGKLSGKTLDQLRAGERVAVSSAKRDPLDFVLWKSAKADEPEESKWSSPFGQGRPGWHIECSAMSRSVLGLPLDIHGGGPDLKFPHHENEIAQSEGAFGGTLANTWMHCGPLMVDTEKMSKSLGNFMTIRQTVCADAAVDQVPYQANPREAEMLRFFIVRNHYRSIQNYAPENLADAQSALDRLYQTLQAVPPALNFDGSSIDWSTGAPADFKQAMDDDFNTAGAVSVLFELASSANRDQDTQASALLRVLGELIGLLQQVPSEYFKAATRYTKRALEAAAAAQALHGEQETVVQAVVVLDNETVDQLIAKRKAAKVARDFATADRIRNQLADSGVLLDDKPGGLTEWRRG